MATFLYQFVTQNHVYIYYIGFGIGLAVGYGIARKAV